MKKCFILIVMFVFLPVASVSLAAEATAHIRGTAPGSTLSGKAAFEDTAEGLKVSAEVHGAPPGRHGFHIHEIGDCADTGSAAGGHFNPDGLPHGLLMKEGVHGAHAGDLGNIDIAPDGTGTYAALLPGLALGEGKYAVAGRAVILHEKEDDFGQPAGNAGGRIGCGVIQLEG